MNNILSDLMNDEEFLRLIKLKNYLNENNELISLIRELKDIQKSLVEAKVNGEFNKIKELDNRRKIKEEQILNFPFYEEYIELLEDLKRNLSMLKNEIEEDFVKNNLI